MLPLRDLNPSRRFAIVNVGLIAINVLVFIYQWLLQVGGAAPEQVYSLALVPYDVTHHFSLTVAETFFTSMFMHANLAHIGFNMLYLWIFGDNVEDAMGHTRYLVFYLLAGIGAALAQVLVMPDSNVPNVGASGAIAGVLGAYLILYPNARILSIVTLIYFIRLVEVPAFILLLLWFGLQFLSGVTSLGIGEQGGGVAYFAHIGGFVFGILTVKLFTLGRPARSAGQWWENL